MVSFTMLSFVLAAATARPVAASPFDRAPTLADQVPALAAAHAMPAAHSRTEWIDDESLGTPQDDASAIRALKPRGQWEVIAGVWTPRAGGQTRFAQGSVNEIEVGTGMSLDDKEITPNLEIRYRPQTDWEIGFGGFLFSTKVSNVTFNGPDAQFGSVPLVSGESFSSSFDLDSAHLEVTYCGYRPFDRERDGGEADLGLHPTVGVRWMNVRHDVERSGFGRERGGGDYGAVTFGGQFRLHWAPEGGLAFIHGIGIEIAAAAGPAFGDGTGFIAQVRSGVRFEIVHNIDIMIAYRLLEMNVRDGSEGYRLTGGLQGMFFTVGVRF